MNKVLPLAMWRGKPKANDEIYGNAYEASFDDGYEAGFMSTQSASI